MAIFGRNRTTPPSTPAGPPPAAGEVRVTAAPATAARVTEAQVTEALRPVEDPELHRSIVDLDMVRRIGIDGGRVTVLVALTVAGCPLRAEITNRVTAAVSPLPGVEAVSVDMTVMTDDERAALREKLQGPGHAHENAGQAGHGHAHGPTKAAPFMEPESRTRMLGVTSGKGGVGKSSVTVNLAIALAKLGHQVAVLNADVYGFMVPKMLGIDQ